MFNEEKKYKINGELLNRIILQLESESKEINRIPNPANDLILELVKISNKKNKIEYKIKDRISSNVIDKENLTKLSKYIKENANALTRGVNPNIEAAIKNLNLSTFIRDIDRMSKAFDEFEDSEEYDIFIKAVNSHLENNHNIIDALIYGVNAVPFAKVVRGKIASIGKIIRGLELSNKYSQCILLDVYSNIMITDEKYGMIVNLLIIRNVGITSFYDFYRLIKNTKIEFNLYPANMFEK